MKLLTAFFVLFSSHVYATSLSDPLGIGLPAKPKIDFRKPARRPGLSLPLENMKVSEMPDNLQFNDRDCGTFLQTGLQFSPKVRDQLLDIVDQLQSRNDYFNLDKSNMTDEVTSMFQSIINDYKKTNEPIFFDPKTGKTIYTDMLNPGNKPMPKDDPNAIKGCVSKTHCKGEGKDRECDTWEVCIGT